ncbi:SRPBCC family protein [Mycobacterium sp. CPCC 205372]|uniref:SRPBCC family protein n=1 Tax=Mycobacterium hippophais TaxID=3016340 RepID=A0ABT4PZX6_9MYCO|nr:SRPBCC family protein [Mycobacterium hippophais]MCZ8381999.1 SRPBCC family protein [Mycobacterium hippophais]
MGIVTTSSETLFTQPAEAVYDFVTDPANWARTYPGGPRISGVPDELPLRVGDTWQEAHPTHDRVFTWQLAVAARPRVWVFHSVGRLGAGGDGDGGLEGRMAVEYRFTRPAPDTTLFTRTMTIEAYRDAPLSDNFFRIVNPAHIDAYHAAVARELAG